MDFILEQGEGLKIEFKESFDSKSLAKEIVAFVNSKGGRIFLGISDDGRIKGIKITNKLKSQIQDIARKCDPFVKINLEHFDNVLIINVLEGENKPYQCSLGFFIREGPNSQKLSRDEIMKFVTEIGRVRFDEQMNEDFKFPEDFDKDKFNQFLIDNRLSKNNKITEILINLSLGKKIDNSFKLNNAGVLFFGKNIEKFIRQNFVTCVLYKGKERVNIIDRKDFKTDLISNYNDSLNFLKQHLRLEYKIEGGGPRKEILEIPEEALKEALLNSLAHRDYFEKGVGIFVEIFDDRIEIYNKGKLLFDKKDLGKISLSRNPIIFNILHRIGLIEKIGSGINRIKKLIKERNLKVRFETNGFFRIIFERSDISQKTVEKTVEKIINLIKENPTIIQEEISKKTGLTRRGVEWNLKKLKGKGILKRIGSKKGGYWKVVDIKNDK